MQDLQQLKIRLREFAEERDWDQFHSPKNLSMALIGEAAELVEHFQWSTQAQSSNVSHEQLSEIELELADIFLYLVRLADKLNVDLLKAASKKIEINAQKYPAHKVKGKSDKYTAYDKDND
ncbi:MAG: nucleotide pyrophosphohydrolase [Gammaproteobacteria bacterium SG8_11]|nr:MAG: nucleotide pyrophosphohydrolase [Gammaproteobacteria bacterium SG8_11]